MPCRCPQRRAVRPGSEDLTTAAGHDVVQCRAEHPPKIAGGRALGTHAGCKQRCIGCGKVKTELLNRFPDGGSDNHTDAAEDADTAVSIAAGVLSRHAIHDASGHAAAVLARMLDLPALGVRRQCQDEQAPPVLKGEIKRRTQGLEAEKGADRDGVRAQRAVVGEVGMSVRSHGRADVAALDIEQGQRAGLAQAGKRALEHGDPRRTEALEERRLWLDDRHRPGERLDAGHGKRLQALDGLTQAPVRQQCRVGVDAGTERAELVHGDPKPGPEGGSHRLCSHRVWAIPTASLNRANPLSCRAAASSRLTRIGAVGSLKVAVPTWIALAPAATSCSASSPVRTPPTPMIGTAGRRPSIMAARTCQMARTATGRMAGPDSPPVTPATWGSNRSVSMTIASRVLIMVSPSAPALTQARAISTMSVTSGLSLAKTGMLRGSVSRTRAMTVADDRVSHANTCPRFATLGQEMLTSTPTTASNAGDSSSAKATSAYSPAVFPAMDTSTRAPTDLSHTRSPEANSAIPGPCRPIELSIPLGVSAILGVPRPDRGSASTVLVTKAPSPAMSKKRCSSLPLAAQPEAVISGFGRLIPARSTRMSMARLRSVVSVAVVAVSVVSRSVVSLLVTFVLPGSSVPAHRHSAESILGNPAAAVLKGLPADPVATEDRALDTGTSHSGQTVVAGHRHDAGHTDPDAAGHGLLDRNLGNRAGSRGEIGDRPEHRHRPARVDSPGATAADDVGQHVGDPALDARRAVVSGHRDRVCGTTRLHDPEELVNSGCTQHHLHMAATR